MIVIAAFDDDSCGVAEPCDGSGSASQAPAKCALPVGDLVR